MFSSDLRYSKFTDCGSCPEYRKHIFKYRSYPKGIIIPRERCLQNTLYFLLKGSVQVNSEEHPDTVFHEGQFILQPIGSKVEFKILEAAECILYLFERPMNVCNERFNKGASIAETSRIEPVVMNMCPAFAIFRGRDQNVSERRPVVLRFPECQTDRTGVPAQLLLYIKRTLCFLLSDLPVQQELPLFHYAELYEGKRCGNLRTDGWLQHADFPPSIQRDIRRTRLPMDAEKEM